MKNTYVSIALLCVLSMGIQAQTTGNNRITELLKNPSFEEEAKPIRNRRFGPNGEGELFGAKLPAGIIPGWIVIDDKEENSKIGIITDNLLDTTQQKALQWKITKAPATIGNVGFQGIEVKKGCKYTLTFLARTDKKYRGRLQIGLQDKRDAARYVKAMVKGRIKKRWKRYTLTFTAKEDISKAHFVMTANKLGTLYLDRVSLTIR